MALGLNLLRSIISAAAKIGVKKLAYAAGQAAGMGGTYAEAAADVGLSFFEDVFRSFVLGGRDANVPSTLIADPARQRDLRAEIAHAAQSTGDDLARAAAPIITELAPQMPPNERELLLSYVTMLPDRFRRTLSRSEDPSGRTVPDALTIRSPLDLAAFLPPLPRFVAGQTPVYNRTLVRLLGVGAFGEVWEAAKAGFENRRVALKFCLGDDAALMHEARLAQRLEHQGIVQLFEIHPPTSRPACGEVPLCLEFEFVEGSDLSAWWLSRRIDSGIADAAARVIARLAEIVQVAHGHRGVRGDFEPIVHRDLKPGNVLVARTARGYQLKITDFGIGGVVRAAEAVAAATRERTLNRQGSSYTLDALSAYTPRYAPDEQREGAAADPRQDIHALGVIWYQMLRQDFSLAAPRGGGWKRHLRQTGVPETHLELIERCVDSDPQERPENGAALAAAIRETSAAQPGSPRPDSAPTESPRLRVPAEPKILTPAKPRIIEARFPMTEAEARQVQAAAAKALGVPVAETLDFGRGVTLDMMLIPAGEFLMGSPENEPERSSDETQHQVTISRPFYMCKTEVTQAQWQAVMGSNPSYFNGDGQLPVEQVSWVDCQEFCRKLSARTGQAVRLPSEAEWEYACRAGTATRYGFGDDEARLGEYAWFTGNSGGKTHAVGQMKPNAWGLHDMHGNVWEWCGDWYGAYPAGGGTDPAGPGSGASRVLRGGSWHRNPSYCRAAYRVRGTPGLRNLNCGVRVVVSGASAGTP